MSIQMMNKVIADYFKTQRYRRKRVSGGGCWFN